MEQIHLIVPHSSCLCTIYHNGKAKVMMVDSVETEPQYRRKGHAAKLLQLALNLAKDRQVDTVELVVNSDNEIAKHLYENMGFGKTDKEHWRIILNVQ